MPLPVQAPRPAPSSCRAAGPLLVAGLLTLAAGEVDGRVGAAEEIRYTLRPAERTLERITDPRRIGLLEKLNRADRRRLARLGYFLVPNRWITDELAYSPLPQRVAALRREPKALVVHQPTQVFGAYEAGRLVRWGPVSSGRRDQATPAGAFHLNWRSRARHSTVNPDWYLEWYFNFQNRRGLSLHQYELPGVPASHACVRLLERDARWIYEWGEEWELDERGWDVVATGTPLWALGIYDFDALSPWLEPDDLHPRVELPPAAFRTDGSTPAPRKSRPRRDGPPQP